MFSPTLSYIQQYYITAGKFMFILPAFLYFVVWWIFSGVVSWSNFRCQMLTCNYLR